VNGPTLPESGALSKTFRSIKTVEKVKQIRIKGTTQKITQAHAILCFHSVFDSFEETNLNSLVAETF
jgi:hypothetical protein